MSVASSIQPRCIPKYFSQRLAITSGIFDFELLRNFITRSGAIRAGAGELGIIPGSMGARSYIVRGKGNEKSFSSCAHGAGRRMSRTAARKQFSREDLVEPVHTLKQVLCVKG